MKVRLTRKLADRIDDVDLSGCSVGDTVELPEREAKLLVAEEWALPERRVRDTASEFAPRRRAEDAASDDSLSRVS
jgi:hypothetical protein